MSGLPLIARADELLLVAGLHLLRARFVAERKPVPPRLDELLAAAADGGGRSRTFADGEGVSVLGDPDARPVPLFLTTSQYADVVGCSDRAVRRRCAAGEIAGAHRQGKAWLIPRPNCEA